jgi:hypothetical protein
MMSTLPGNDEKMSEPGFVGLWDYHDSPNEQI